MNPLRLLALSAALAVAYLTPLAAQTMLSPADEQQIQQSVLLLIDRTVNDPMATLTQYVRNDRVTSVNSESIVTGWDGLVRQTEGQRAGAFMMQTGRLDIVGMGPDHALVVAPFTMAYRVDGAPVSVPGSMTLGYERTAEGWKIVHEHYSQGLDDQTRQRLSRAASGRGGVTGSDLMRLFLIGIGSTPTRFIGAVTQMLQSQGCTAR